MSTKAQTRTLAFQANERNIFFHILTACNLSCRHCYINKEQHGSNTLSPQQIADWLQLFYKKDRSNNIIFLGGEPTLHPDLPFAVKTAKKIGYSSITIDTNGFLHHSLLQKITPSEAVLSFSLDGPTPQVNDPIRGVGVFDVCTTNMRLAVDAGFEVSVIYTVNALNIDSLHLMPKLLKDLGVHHFFIQIIGLRGNSSIFEQKEGNSLQITRSQWQNTVPAVAQEAAATGLHVIYPKVFLAEDETFECAANVADNYFVFPNGRVYLCPLCEDFPVNSYQIQDNKLVPCNGLVEKKFFSLNIQEGCVMNKLLQSANIEYDADGRPLNRISCCLLKQEIYR